MMIKRYAYVVRCNICFKASIRNWAIATYCDKEMAELHIELAKAWAKEHGIDTHELVKITEANPYDPQLPVQVMACVARYSLERIPLADHIDQFIEVGYNGSSDYSPLVMV